MTYADDYGGETVIPYDVGLGTDYGRDTDDWAPLEGVRAGRTKANPVTVTEWCDAVGVWAPLLPFEYRQSDALDAIDCFRAGFDAAPPTKATLSLADWRDDKPALQGAPSLPMKTCAAGHLAQDVMPLLGSWMVSCTGGRDATWINPEYVHLGTMGIDPLEESDPNIKGDVTGTAARKHVVRRWAALGVHERSAVATRLDLTTNALHRWCQRNDVSWAACRQAGKARLARTIRTIVAWTDRTQHEIATSIGAPEGSVRDWCTRYVDETAWTPPADPSHETWFSGKPVPAIATDGGGDLR